MRWLLLSPWEPFAIIAAGAFLLAYLWESLFPYFPKYPLPDDDDGEEK